MIPVRCAAIAATLLTVATPVGTAHASEASYLERLRVDYGYQIGPDYEPYALKTGHFVCDLMHDGTSRETVVGLFKVYNDQATRERKLGPAEVNALVDAAQLELCPDTLA
ncbi:DUF732 domain-containing protein [Mycolicibacterium peregrinum]|uniref:DUF732 domain-containing protein n=1 Tax=Mycolicibacterium peregrinum TaxID=43304 RepID=A0A4Z0HL71_MYCPR|nr:DUF732 domain-containing protein [Mycolicibacterium peregrinum]TGB40332.1 DUF732 domain-containing protein [Mycolicibacterium peregrinum]TGB42792.1 DUF732 domain-containing protein [Mycolicibacterium peregrinum]